jgi:opacity protein-like surface antigen
MQLHQPCIGVLVALAAIASAHAAEKAIKAAPREPQVWEREFGTRFWYSTGRTRSDLLNFAGTFQGSRLTYADLTAGSGEGFFRFDHRSGAFLKGYVGAGDVFGGHLTDEDFPPLIANYSSTNSSQKGGRLNYFDIDAGSLIYRGAGGRLGAFVGYHRWHEKLDAFGCTSNVPGSVCDVPVADSVRTITQENTWQSLRIGLSGDIKLTDQLKASGEAAYVPRTYMSGSDAHWLLIGVPGGFNGPTPQDGRGSGVQVEALLSYQLADWFRVGVGGRYWHLETRQFTGYQHFEISGLAPGNPQPIKFTTDRLGVFLQASACLACMSAAPAPAPQASGPTLYVKGRAPGPVPLSWSGFYAGLHAGYGFNETRIAQSADPAAAILVGPGGGLPTGISLFADRPLGGAQAGHNYRVGDVLLGIEADGSYARLKGSRDFVTQPAGFFIIPFEQDISWLVTLRGRLGLLPHAPFPVAIYGTGGLASGGTSASVGLRHEVLGGCGPGATCGAATMSQTSVGWTAGGGFARALSDRTTFRGEYLWVDLGSKSVTYPFAPFPPTNPNITATAHYTAHIARIGADYRLD